MTAGGSGVLGAERITEFDAGRPPMNLAPEETGKESLYTREDLSPPIRTADIRRDVKSHDAGSKPQFRGTVSSFMDPSDTTENDACDEESRVSATGPDESVLSKEHSLVAISTRREMTEPSMNQVTRSARPSSVWSE